MEAMSKTIKGVVEGNVIVPKETAVLPEVKRGLKACPNYPFLL